MRGKFNRLAFMTLVEVASFRFPGGHALFYSADLLGLERQAAAGALGFEVQLGYAGARFGERRFYLITGFLRAGIFLLLGLDLGGKILKIGLCLIQVERELRGFAFKQAEAATDGAAEVAQHIGAQLFVALGFGCLALQRCGLAADFF
jgi:hypothetical protein